MSDTAAQLVDRVFPEVPVRQWVLSLPRPLRYVFAKDSALLAEGLKIFVQEVFRHYRKVSGIRPSRNALPGGVTAIQRYGSSLNLNIHYHSLFADGVFVERGGKLDFVAAPPPSAWELDRVVRRTAERMRLMLAKKGIQLELGREGPYVEETSSEDPDLFQHLQGAAVREWVLMEGRPHPVEMEREPYERDPLRGERPDTGAYGGFNVHAGVKIEAGDREGLRNLCGYVNRPAFSQERLDLLPDGRVRYRLRRKRWDGARSLILTPLEFLEKVAALVPPPRAHLTVYHGVFGPRSRRRRQVVRATRPPEACAHPEPEPDPGPAPAPIPAPPTPASPSTPAPILKFEPRGARRAKAWEGAMPEAPRPGPPAPDPEPLPKAGRLDWASLMRRTFDADVLGCPRCGGRMQVIALIEEPAVIKAILDHEGLPSSPPRAAPARPLAADGELDFDQVG